MGRARVFAPTGREAAELDRRAMEVLGVPGPSLMEAAGRGAAAVAEGLFADGPVVGLVGAGNNGGDALVALRTLASWGREVRAVKVAERDSGRDEGELLHGWPIEIHCDRELSGEDWQDVLAGAGVVLDGVLGTGVRGAPRPRQAEAIRRANGCGCPVLALDLPSGVSAETGIVPGAAVRADVTVAFGGPKLGSLLHPGRSLVGRLVALEIGFPPWGGGSSDGGGSDPALMITPAWVRSRLTGRDPDTHKNAVGRVAVVAGGPGMAGAALLAARASFRAGAGYVRIVGHPENRVTVQAALPEAVFVEWNDHGAVREALAASDAACMGPGLGTDAEAAEVAETVIGCSPERLPFVIDADGLNLGALGSLDLPGIGGAHPVLATPHAGEAARLLRCETEAVRADRPAHLRSLVAELGCTVILKGAPSLVHQPGSRLLVDPQGSSDLAVAGMGDALAGVCTALLARGHTPEEAGALGLHLTGRAAQLAGVGMGVTPSDVADLLPAAVAEVGTVEGTRWERAPDLPLPFVVFDAPPAR